MGVELILLFIALALSLGLSAYISGLEVGFYALNKTRLMLRLGSGHASARVVQRYLARPDQAIATVLIGNNLLHYIASALCAVLWRASNFDPYLGNLFLLTPFMFLFCEVVPKNLFAVSSERLTYSSIRLYQCFHYLFYPFSFLLSLLSRIAGGGENGALHSVPRTRSLIGVLLEESRERGLLSRQQMDMVRNTLAISEVPISSVMIPLEEAVMIPIEASAEEVLATCRRSRFSRFPIYRHRKSAVVGILNMFEFFSAGGAKPISEIMQPVETLSQSLTLFEALRHLQRRHHRMGVIANERGEAVGIVTVKDIVEEIVGELHDL